MAACVARCEDNIILRLDTAVTDYIINNRLLADRTAVNTSVSCWVAASLFCIYFLRHDKEIRRIGQGR